MASLAQTEFDAWATAVETALGTNGSFDPTLVPVNSKINATIYRKMLADFQEAFDVWAANTATNTDTNPGDSRSRVADIDKYSDSVPQTM